MDNKKEERKVLIELVVYYDNNGNISRVLGRCNGKTYGSFEGLNCAAQTTLNRAATEALIGLPTQ